MKKIFIIVFVFVGSASLWGSIVHAGNIDLICNQNCTRTYPEHEGMVTLNLVCNESSGSSITGTLTVNGVTNTQTVACQFCGNGVVEVPEACDLDKYTADGVGGCATDCMSVQEGYNCDKVITLDDGELVCDTKCGDAVLKGFEQCDDDDNTYPSPPNNGDGCSANCEIEERWECDTAYGATSTCYPGEFCGNGKIGQDETCDDGIFTWNPFDAPIPKNGDGCSATCQIEYGWACQGEPSVCTRLPVCGNGIVQQGEECDDGNTLSGDECSAKCVSTPRAPTEGCDSRVSASPFFSGQQWYSGDVEVFMTCVTDEGGSGCLASCEEVPNRHTFTSNEDPPVTLCGRDVAGNIIHQEVSVNWIDKMLPLVKRDSFQCQTADGQSYVGDTWANQNVTCFLLAEDMGASGLLNIRTTGISLTSDIEKNEIYNLKDKITWQFTQEGKALFNESLINISDCAENQNDVSNQTALQNFPGVFIDKTPPTFDSLECLSRDIEYSGVGSEEVSKVGSEEFSNGWTNQDVECSYSVSDPNTEFNSGLSRWDTEALAKTGAGGNDPWEIHEKGSQDGFEKVHVFSSNQDQIYDFSAELEDAARNVTTYKDSLEIKIDKTQPTFSQVVCTSNGEVYTGKATDQFHGWTNSDVTCEYAIEDPNPEYNSQLKQWQHLFAPVRGFGEKEAWE